MLLLRPLADRGDAEAQFNLGVMYANGRGVPQDDWAAASWYRKAADQGNALAQNNLGNRYANGRGVAQNDAAAVSWYRKAADQDYAIAQYNLGVMYDNGRGVPQDHAAALNWYRKAADQGYAAARNKLGVMYGTGESAGTGLVLPGDDSWQARYTIDVVAGRPDQQPTQPNARETPPLRRKCKGAGITSRKYCGGAI
jgi:TPR repeat protein